MRQPTDAFPAPFLRALFCALGLFGAGSVQAVETAPPRQPAPATAKTVERFAERWIEEHRSVPSLRSAAERHRTWARKVGFGELSRSPRTSLFHHVSKRKIAEPGSGIDRRIGRRRVVTTLYNIHTREALPLIDGRAPVGRLFDDLTRCRGFGERKTIDPRLLEIVVAAASHFLVSKVEIISAYRSQKFNDALAKKGRHVATRSRHIDGQAIDVTFVGVDADKVGDWLWKTFDGGVGVYRENNFVHIDIGPKRRWFGR